MATKLPKRQLRAKNKAKAARVKKQQEIERGAWTNSVIHDFVHVKEPLLSLFATLPEPDDDFSYIVPIVDYSLSQHVEKGSDGDELVDDIAMLAATYVNMGCFGNGTFTIGQQHELFMSFLLNPTFMNVLLTRLKYLQELNLEPA